ncbi:MAG: IS3 family transposase [Candidatus Spechtbacterales bacterium]
MHKNIKILCEIAEVSTSGYYKRLKTADDKDKDYEDYLTIKKICQKGKMRWGYRRVCMELDGKMNHKKILRIMNKYGLLAKTRRANPYRQMAKKTQEHRTFPNILDRNFKQEHPRSVFCADITYLPFNHRFAYLSAVKDIATKEIVAAHLSMHIDVELVIRTMEKFRKDSYMHKEALIHSDQGFHYTNPEFIALTKQLRLTQSMSRKGNCIDNAPIESFFGHFKDEIDYKSCRTFEELEMLINNYIDHYNNERRQWELKKMTPVQYRDHLLMK